MNLVEQLDTYREALDIANKVIEDQANNNDKLVKSLNEKIIELEKENTELRHLIEESITGIASARNVIQKAMEMAKTKIPPDDAA